MVNASVEVHFLVSIEMSVLDCATLSVLKYGWLSWIVDVVDVSHISVDCAISNLYGAVIALDIKDESLV